MREKLFKLLSKNAAFAALFAFLCLLFLVERAFPQIEEKADAYFEDSITQAATVFATARVINGAISVVEESSVSGAPGGVGIDIAAGQILDPIDDVIERLSDILFTTIISLGIQKIVYEIFGEIALVGAFFLLTGSLLCGALSKHPKWKTFNLFLKKAALLLLLVRMALPCTALIANAVETHFFAPKIAEAQQRFAVLDSGDSVTFEFDFSDDDGFFDKINKAWDRSKETFESAQKKLGIYLKNAGMIVSTSLDIAALYIALFIVQVIFLPMAAFYLMVKMTNGLFGKPAEVSQLPVATTPESE